MPISTVDPVYRAEIVPSELARFAIAVRARFGLPSANVGIKGDSGHASGYHRSRRWILQSPDSRYGASDYSVRSADDLAGDSDWLAAVDISFGSTATLIQVCRRLKAASDRDDPRLHGWREFLGTLDGVHPYGWDFVQHYAKVPDRSHLYHLHLSRQRRYANTPMTAILGVMADGEDDEMLTGEQAQQLSNLHTIIIALANGKSGNLHPHVPASPVAGWWQAAAAGAVALSDEQLAALAEQISDRLVDAVDNPLGADDKPAIVEAVKQALREGAGAGAD